MKKNIYQPLRAEIREVIQETPNIKTFVFKPEAAFSFQTGQFIELTVPGIGEAPFTPSSDPSNKETIEVTIVNVGRVTARLHEMKRGEAVGIRGPYGKGYPLERFKSKDILVVGGGVGLAPLRSLLFSLFNQISLYNQVILRYGARTPMDIVYKDAVYEWGKKDKVNVITTVDRGDPSWTGNVGIVTSILKDFTIEQKNAAAIVCGPPIMMKFVTLKLLEIGLNAQDIYLSMEKSMSCGLGKCGHCRLGRFFACKDGPVFTYDQLKDLHDNIWD